MENNYDFIGDFFNFPINILFKKKNMKTRKTLEQHYAGASIGLSDLERYGKLAPSGSGVCKLFCAFPTQIGSL